MDERTPEFEEKPEDAFEKPKVDFFISYTSKNIEVAKWVASVLEEAGYSFIVQFRDFKPGGDFVENMDFALKNSKQIIAILSHDYFKSEFTMLEAFSGISKDPIGKNRLIIPIRIDDVQVEGVFASRTYIDISNHTELKDSELAKDKILSGISKRGVELKSEYPVDAFNKPKLPGNLPRIWNVPLLSNPNFMGRTTEMNEIEKYFREEEPKTMLLALYGLGGAGKTQLAIEYAYEHAVKKDEYSLVWWLKAEDPITLELEFASLANELSLPEMDEINLDKKNVAVKTWLGRSNKWLLIFDNADDIETIKDYIPEGNGRIIVTSRNPNWRRIAYPLEITVFDSENAISFLTKRTGINNIEGAKQLATELGNLPLALEQAAAYIELNSLTYEDYIDRFRNLKQKLWEHEVPPLDYSGTIATTWKLSMEKIAEKSPKALELLNLFSFFDPNKISLDLLSGHTNFLTNNISNILADGVELDQAISAFRKYSLINFKDGNISMHKLVQDVIRDNLPKDIYLEFLQRTIIILNEAFTFQHDDIKTWDDKNRSLIDHIFFVKQFGKKEDSLLGITASLLRRTGKYFLNVQPQYNVVKDISQEVLELDEKAYGNESLIVSGDLNELAHITQILTTPQKALEFYERALAIDQAIFQDALKNKELADEHMAITLGALPAELGDKNLITQSSISVARDLNGLGNILQEVGDPSYAKVHFQKALNILEKVNGLRNAQVANIYDNLGKIQIDLGEMTEATFSLGKSLEISKEIFGINHPQTAQGLASYGMLLNIQGKLEESLEYLNQALNIHTELYRADHPSIAYDLNVLGQIHFKLNDLEIAKDFLERSLKMTQNILGENHPRTSLLLNNLAMVYQNLNEDAKAWDSYQRSAIISHFTYGPTHPNTILVKGNFEEFKSLLRKRKEDRK